MSDFLQGLVFATGLSRSVLQRIARTAAHRYKAFSVPKRNGRGFREIAQPAREVKMVQRAVVSSLSGRLPVHDAVTAYRKGVSIRDNAKAHVGSKYLLKLDFENFFTSIKADDLRAHLVRHCSKELDLQDIELVVSACTWRRSSGSELCICIGAPSSPFWANTIPFDLDARLENESRSLGCVYTRYSDDLTFSSIHPERLGLLEARVREVVASVAYPRLAFADKKRISVSRKTAFRVTGLVLSQDGGVTVGRQRKRKIRAGLDHYLRGTLPPDMVAKLRGEIAFVVGIEPSFVEVVRRLLGDKHDSFMGKLMPG